MDVGLVAPAFKWVVFIITAIVALFGSIMMVTRKNPIHSALWLVVTFFSLAVIYLTLNAQFMAIAQIVVYAGAIMMLIVFVIMLIHMETDIVRKMQFSAAKTLGVFITAILFIEMATVALAWRAGHRMGNAVVQTSGKAMQLGDVKSIGTALYGKYLFPFEIASILLLIGIVGAVVLARRQKD